MCYPGDQALPCTPRRGTTPPHTALRPLTGAAEYAWGARCRRHNDRRRASTASSPSLSPPAGLGSAQPRVRLSVDTRSHGEHRRTPTSSLPRAAPPHADRSSSSSASLVSSSLPSAAPARRPAGAQKSTATDRVDKPPPLDIPTNRPALHRRTHAAGRHRRRQHRHRPPSPLPPRVA